MFFSSFRYMLRKPPYAPSFSDPCLRRLVVFGFVLSCLAWACLMLHRPAILDSDSLRAVETMRNGMSVLKKMRQRLGIPVDLTLDPAGTGLIGTDYNDLTTTIGSLSAKRTSLNPLFAGLITTWLKHAGVRQGDTVAVCLTGSFPALNLAVLSACRALRLRPIVFSSVGASTYGANFPEFTWLDMELELLRSGILDQGTSYASLGGIMDTGGGLDGTGYALGEAAILRHGAVYIRENGESSLEPDIARRLKLYTEQEIPAAFINVGGGITSLGWVSEAALLDNGLLARIPTTSSPRRGIIFRMYERGVPVIHLLNIERLASRNGLPIAPEKTPSEQDWVRGWYCSRIGTGILLALWLFGAAFFVRLKI